MSERLLIWEGVDEWRAEAASVRLERDGILATGTQLGAGSPGYRLEYRLYATQGWVTRSLELEASGDGWSRRLSLSREPDGRWFARGGRRAELEPPEVSGPLAGLEDALDCDLAFSPLTNLMPIRRHGLDRDPGDVELTVAFVSVPELEVQPSRQRYEHVRTTEDGSVVRYVDRGAHAGFTAELALGPDGFIVDYPELARRIA